MGVRITARITASPTVSRWKMRPPQGTEPDGQRQSRPEQSQRQADAAAKLPQVDAGGVGEEDQRQRRLGQVPGEGAGADEIDAVEGAGTEKQPEGDEDHRWCDRRAHQPA